MIHETRRWEYHQLPATPRPSTKELNALGDQGWELTAYAAPAGHFEGAFFFKRPAPGFRERITLDQRARVGNTRETAE